jgi:hypothetical protein
MNAVPENTRMRHPDMLMQDIGLHTKVLFACACEIIKFLLNSVRECRQIVFRKSITKALLYQHAGS